MKKTDIYEVTLSRRGSFLAKYRFVGRGPTKGDLLVAIELRWQGLAGNVTQAKHEKLVASTIGVPPEINTSDTWEIMGVELGKVQVQKVEAWTL